MKIHYTDHGMMRCNQRGFNGEAVRLLQECGKHSPDDHAEVLVMTDREVTEAIQQRKREIQQLEKLRNCKAVFHGERLASIYRNNRKQGRRR